MSVNGNPVAVVAVGGNALIRAKTRTGIADQYEAAALTMAHVADLIDIGWNVVVTHGNGPQVGFMQRRSELSRQELHEVPLDYSGAHTQARSPTCSSARFTTSSCAADNSVPSWG